MDQFLLFFLCLFVVAFVIFAIRSARSERLKPGKVADLSHLPPQFVIVDVETTGLSPDHHQIIEIGAIKANRDSSEHITFQTLVKCKGKVPKKITDMTGITSEMLERDGRELEDAMTQFLDFAGDLRLIAYNASFDLGFLSNAAKSINRELNNPVSDALDMARRAWPGRKSYKLVSLAKDGGLNTNGAHRSLHDCTVTLHVYCAASIKLRRMS